MKPLYLIRGMPGAGKSTFAETLASSLGAEWCEADHYFCQADGMYDFDARQLHHAHKHCFWRTEDAMEAARPIVVSNTFTTEKELKPYLALAEKHGYHVTTIIVENRHGNASIHGVPDETLDKMRKRFSVKL